MKAFAEVPNSFERKNMFKFLSGLLLTAVMTTSSFAQNSDADYRIYDARGNAVTLEKIIDSLKNIDVVFLGENHDDRTAHFLEAVIFIKSFENYGTGCKVALSLEMFERDTQIVLNEYLADFITEKKFLDDSRPWNNYKTDYRPLVEYARQNKLDVIAANTPRRYVNMVSRNGRDALNALSPEAKKWLAPLPYGEPSKAYADKFNALMGKMPEANMGLNKILASQSLWDATMAFSISGFLRQNKNALIIQINGGFHSESRLGIPEHLLRYNPKVKILVVNIKSDENFINFDKSKYENSGDFVILTNAKTARSFK